MQEVQCSSCKTLQRVEYVGVSLASELPRFCSFCGAATIVAVKIDNYWYMLAAEFGFKRSEEGADFVRELYEVWDTSKYSKFRDFVDAFKAGNID